MFIISYRKICKVVGFDLRTTSTWRLCVFYWLIPCTLVFFHTLNVKDCHHTITGVPLPPTSHLSGSILLSIQLPLPLWRKSPSCPGSQLLPDLFSCVPGLVLWGCICADSGFLNGQHTKTFLLHPMPTCHRLLKQETRGKTGTTKYKERKRGCCSCV